MRIVIIDDQEHLINSIEKVLTTEAQENHSIFKILISRNKTCDEVVSEISKLNPDIIFMDNNLQNTYTGEDVVKKLQHIPTYKIIGTSSLDPQEYCGHYWPCKTLLEKDSFRKASLISLFKIIDLIEKQEKENVNTSRH